MENKEFSWEKQPEIMLKSLATKRALIRHVLTSDEYCDEEKEYFLKTFGKDLPLYLKGHLEEYNV